MKHCELVPEVAIDELRREEDDAHCFVEVVGILSQF
jgi:hypothetical protein